MLLSFAKTARYFKAGSWRPYVFAIVWMLIADGIMYLGDRYLLRYGFPWALVSLLVVAAVANICGTGPAVLVVVISALFGDTIVPDLHISYFYGQPEMWNIALIRVLLFLASGSTMILLAHRARIMQEDAERRKAVVQALQSMVLPESLPAPQGYDLAGLYKPARTEEDVGGDFYDFFPIAADETLWGILIGDVMGKGKEAAVYTALLRYSIRAYAHATPNPGHILERVTDLVDAQRLRFPTASVFLGVLDANSGELSYANAGHDPPIVVHNKGPEELLGTTGLLIGVLPDARYESKCIKLNLGDAMLLFTDGVTEARSPSGKFLDSSGASRILQKALNRGKARVVIEAIAQEVSSFSGGNQQDDIALLLLKRVKLPVDAR